MYAHTVMVITYTLCLGPTLADGLDLLSMGHAPRGIARSGTPTEGFLMYEVSQEGPVGVRQGDKC